MKIRKITIQNFRNIRNLVIEVKPNGLTVIEGDNNIGKSNALNAICWFDTDSLYTDKWGTGENDIQSIIPINQVKGEYVSVAVEFDSGIVFEKRYTTSYDLRTGKVKAHTTEGYINSSAAKNMRLWTDELYKAFGYTPSLQGFKELNLFTDPLYALQKLDAKDLRVLLQTLGCSITNEEVFKALSLGSKTAFMEMEAPKYRNNFYDMRADYKRMLLADKQNIENLENQLNVFNAVEEFSDTKLKEINQELEVVNQKYYSVGNQSAEQDLQDKQNKLRELKNQRDEIVNNFKAENFNKKARLINEINNEQRNIENLKNKANKGVYEAIEHNKHEIDLQIKTIEAYNNSKIAIQNSIERSSNLGKSSVVKQREVAAKLKALQEETYRDFITCPNCNHQFILDESKKDLWEFNHKRDIDLCNTELAQLKDQVTKELADFKMYKEQLAQTEIEYNKAVENLELLQNRANELQSHIVNDGDCDIDYSKLQKMEFEMQQLEREVADTSLIDKQIDDLNESVLQARLNRDAELQKLRSELQAQKDQLLEAKRQEEIKKYDAERKADLQKKHDEAISVLNDRESQLAIINQFIHKSIELCNAKAKALTGFEFVMLEETLSDTVKEVCYMLVDGVPFKNVNTSRKLLIGTQFIKRVKEILQKQGITKNDLPILADKLETISNATLGKYNDLFNDIQFITTKVTEGKEIKVC